MIINSSLIKNLEAALEHALSDMLHHPSNAWANNAGGVGVAPAPAERGQRRLVGNSGSAMDLTRPSQALKAARRLRDSSHRSTPRSTRQGVVQSPVGPGGESWPREERRFLTDCVGPVPRASAATGVQQGEAAEPDGQPGSPQEVRRLEAEFEEAAGVEAERNKMDKAGMRTCFSSLLT